MVERLTLGDRVYLNGVWVVKDLSVPGLVTVGWKDLARDIPREDLEWDEPLQGWLVLPPDDYDEEC